VEGRWRESVVEEKVRKVREAGIKARDNVRRGSGEIRPIEGQVKENLKAGGW